MRPGPPSLRSLPLDRLLLPAILLLAAFLRFFRLDQVPPGFYFDQAFNAFDILRLLQGQFAIFFPANTGREPLYFYLAAVNVALFGPTALALKITSAIIGLATIPLVYGIARGLFNSTRVAALAAFLTTVSFWHIFYSRLGLRVVLEVPLTLLTFGYYWRALEHWRPRDFALAGLFTALGIYTYPSARLLPFALLVLTAWAIWNDRSNWRAQLRGLGLTLLVAAIILLPLGIYFAIHPDQFISHTVQVSLLSPDAAQKNAVGAMLDNARRIGGMFFISGDTGLIRNLPGRPVFDPLTAFLFVCGLGVAAVALFSRRAERANRSRAFLLAIWSGSSLVTSLLSDDAPNFLRTLPALPALMLLAAWGASELWTRFDRHPARGWAIAGLGVILLSSTVVSFRDYFVVFANHPGLYYGFDEDKVQVADWVNAQASTADLYLAPLWAQQGTISLLTRKAVLKSFDSRDTIVLPSGQDGRDAVYGFPPEQEKRIETLAERLGGIGAREDLSAPNGAKLLLVYRVPADRLQSFKSGNDGSNPTAGWLKVQVAKTAIWENRIQLLGYSTEATGRGRNIAVTLYLRALQPMQEDYNFSIKARDAQGRVWGQEDKFPGGNSYPTTAWSEGDLVIEKFYPGLQACAPGGNYSLTVEAYDPKSGRVLARSDAADNSVLLTTASAEASAGNRPEDLEPDEKLDRAVGSGLHLIGLSLSTPQLSAGKPFSLSLFWQGQGKGQPGRTFNLHLKDSAGHDFPLAQATVNVPAEGRGICTFLDLTAPEQLASGPASLFVNTTEIKSIDVPR